jgi:two-component system, NarL family, invasion response regulator UvrY
MTTVALVDDHTLIRHALIELLNRFDNFQVTIQAGNGEDFVDKLRNENTPDIALIDINMPGMNGYEITEYLCKNYPQIIPIALSVDDNEESVIKMLRCGARGYLLKDSEPAYFKMALEEICQKGYFHSDLISNALLKSIKTNPKVKIRSLVQFQAREEEFIHLACTEYTYKEIADKMCISPRTVDGYRESLFEKLEVKSRVGLVMFAIRNGLVVI